MAMPSGVPTGVMPPAAILLGVSAMQRAYAAFGPAVTATSVVLVLVAAARLARYARPGQAGHSAGADAVKVVMLKAAPSRPEPPPGAAEARRPGHAEGAAEPRRPGHGGPAAGSGPSVQFDPRVACVLVHNLTGLTAHQKADFWWQQDDFEEFLRVRVAIGKAYRAAAKKIGVDVMQVSSVGSHGDEGYREMIEAMPELRDESRRGLGLGRKRQRAKNRDAYIRAVLNEQRRQRSASGGREGSAIGQSVADCEALASVARRVSEKDLSHAVSKAQQYYQQDREAEINTTLHQAIEKQPSAKNLKPPENEPQHPAVPQPEDSSVGLSGDVNYSVVEISSTPLKQDSWLRMVSPTSASSKGFGLSRERLEEVGLAATGHALSRSSRLRGRLVAGQLSDDSDMTAGED